MRWVVMSYSELEHDIACFIDAIAAAIGSVMVEKNNT